MPGTRYSNGSYGYDTDGDQALQVKQVNALVALAGGDAAVANGVANALGGTASTAGAPSLAVSQVAANSAGTATLAARATRRRVALLNSDASLTIYYGPTTGVNAATGFPLTAGASQSLDYVGALFFFAASGAPVVACSETFG